MKIKVTTQKRIVEKKRFLLLFTRPRWGWEEVTEEYDATYRGIEEAILQCCVHESKPAVVTYMNENGEIEDWSLWRLVVEYGRKAVEVKVDEVKQMAEYQATTEGTQKEAEKIAQKLNAEYKRNFSTAVKKAMEGLDNSGIATIL